MCFADPLLWATISAFKSNNEKTAQIMQTDTRMEKKDHRELIQKPRNNDSSDESWKRFVENCNLIVRHV